MIGTKRIFFTWFQYALISIRGFGTAFRAYSTQAFQVNLSLNTTVQDKPWSKKFNQMYVRNDIKDLATEQTAKGSKNHINIFSSQLVIESNEYSNLS